MGKRTTLALAALAAALAAGAARWVRRPPDPGLPPATPPGGIAESPRRPPGGTAGVLPDPAAGPAIRGIVVDSRGAPVPGAEVHAARAGDRVPVRAAAGPDGRFRLPVPDGEAAWLVGARAPGLSPDLRPAGRAGGEEVRLVLRRGARLSGTVRTAEGTPCPGARVRLTLHYPGLPRPAGGPEVRADEDGRFLFEGVPPVETSLEAAWRRLRSPGTRLGPPEEGGGLQADLVVAGGPSLAGTVRDGEGRPLGGIEVVATPVDGEGSRWTDTGPDGTWLLPGLDPRPHGVRFRDPSGRHREARAGAVLPPRSGLDATLEEDPDAPGGWTFRLAPPAGGAPPPAARVLSWREGEARPCGSETAAPGGDGVFRARGKPPGRYRIVLRAGTARAATDWFAVPPGATADLGTLHLAPGAAVRGRILDPGGRPVPEALLVAGEDRLPERAAPAPDGSFEVAGLEPGGGVLRVLHPRFEPLEAPWRAEAGQAADLGSLRLRRATATVRGTVLPAGGPLPAGTVVRLDRAGDPPGAVRREAEAGPDGRFEVREVPAGTWSVSAAAPAGEGTPFRRGARGTALEVREGESLEVRVPGPE